MRRTRSRNPRLAAALGLLAVVACSGPAQPTQTVRTSPVPTDAPTSQATPDGSGLAGIDIASLSGRIAFDDGQDIWSVNANGTDLRRLTDEPWREFQAALSPDRRVIAYRSEPADYPELWLMNADGSGKRQLTPEGGFPEWSRDGSLLAYAPPGGSTGQSWIATMNPDGSGQRRLPDTDFGENPSWSPDGRRIIFTSAPTGTRLMSVVDGDGPGVVELSTAGEGNMVAWSPDGQSILFASHRDQSDNYRDIYVMRPDGSDVRRLTSVKAEAPAWSPDGRYIAFSAPGGLGIMRADGSGIAYLPLAGVGWAGFPDWR